VATDADAALALRPQPGPQHRYLATPADIAVAGGSKYGGKSYSLELDPIRFIVPSKKYPTGVKGFGGVIFRREYPEIVAEGGLWDTSMLIYPYIGGTPHRSSVSWTFPPHNVRIKFSHMHHEDDRIKWEGAQIPFIGIDQAEQFTAKQFWSLVGCNRSTCGVRPRMRLNCNPDPDCFLRHLMGWWIDPESGFAIPERSGVVRWFVRVEDREMWGDDPEELERETGKKPLSFTFIPSSHHDNPIGMEKDPNYEAKLDALPLVERERKKGKTVTLADGRVVSIGGNWNIRETAGTIFQRRWFPVIPAAPQCTRWVRCWDRQATEAAKAKGKGSWTVGLLLGQTAEKPPRYVVADIVRLQGSAYEVDEAIRNTASQDGGKVEIKFWQDPASAGKKEAQYSIAEMAGYVVSAEREVKSKATYARPVSSQAEAGNILVVRAPWTDGFLLRLENFDGTDKCVSDDADALSGAFMELTLNKPKIAGVLR